MRHVLTFAVTPCCCYCCGLSRELIDLRNLINVMESSLDLKAWAVDDITEKQLLAAINDDSTSFYDNYESGTSEAESGVSLSLYDLL